MELFGVLQDGTPIIGDMKKYNEVKESLQEALGRQCHTC